MRFVIVLALVLAGCAAQSQPTKPQSAEEAFAGANDEVSFWIIENDLASLNNTGATAARSDTYKRCVAEGLVAHSAPETSRLVGQFLANKTFANYDLVAADRSDLIFNGNGVPIDDGIRRIVASCS